MSKFIYYPHVVHPKEVTQAWMEEAISWLVRQTTSLEFELGYETQYDRTIDENGDPGEYVQVWMRIEEEE